MADTLQAPLDVCNVPLGGHPLFHGRSDHNERIALVWISRKWTLRVDHHLLYKLA